MAMVNVLANFGLKNHLPSLRRFQSFSCVGGGQGCVATHLQNGIPYELFVEMTPPKFLFLSKKSVLSVGIL